MKTPILIVIVVALHCTVIGALFFIQGCGTMLRTEPSMSTDVMPPPTAEETLPASEAMDEVVVVSEVQVSETTTYVVQPGDSVSKIAKRFHVKLAEIVALNKLLDPNKIRIGQKLLLPGYVDVKQKQLKKKAVSRESVKLAPLPADIQDQGSNIYVVQRRDALSKIAQRFGVTVSAIRAANKLQGNRILVGQKLVIPKLGNESLAGGETDVTVVETTEIFIKPDKKSAGAGKDEFVSGIIHVVQPRENMRSIAKMYAVTVDELAEFNSLFPNDKVLVGQRLKIP